MPAEMVNRRREAALYVEHARQMLEVATSNRDSGI